MIWDANPEKQRFKLGSPARALTKSSGDDWHHGYGIQHPKALSLNGQWFVSKMCFCDTKIEHKQSEMFFYVQHIHGTKTDVWVVEESKEPNHNIANIGGSSSLEESYYYSKQKKTSCTSWYGANIFVQWISFMNIYHLDMQPNWANVLRLIICIFIPSSILKWFLEHQTSSQH